MRRLDTRAGAAVMIALGALCLVGSLATGHRARAEPPADLALPADAALDVWKAAAQLVREPGTAVVDLRPADAFARYRLPGAVNLPGASAETVRRSAAGASVYLVYAGKDEVARPVVAGLREGGARAFYLADGARAWYLAMTLPVPLFSEAAPPAGYADAIGEVQRAVAREPGASAPRALEAIDRLARLDYRPGLLGAPKRKAASGGGGKKIAGGCG